MTTQKRFWTKVKKTPNCWLWVGAGSPNHGRFRDSNSEMVGAHVFAWKDKRGAIPPGLFVLHKCDNPPCVNPDHLFLGTQRDNIQDMLAKGRAACNRTGVDNNNALFTETDLQAIRQSPLTQRALARQFCCHQSSISRVRAGVTYATC